MSILKTIGRILLILIAILVILISVAGIGGTWYVNRLLTDITLQAFSVIETGVAIAESGVNQVNTLVVDSRTEVQQAEQTINDISDHLQENSPVLVALNNRLETRLAPTVAKIDAAIAPIRDGLLAITNIVQFANTIPFVQEQAPNLNRVENVLTTVTGLGADIQQLNDTLAAAVVEEKNVLTDELAGVLTDLTTRIDTALAQVQAEVEALLAEINAFQDEVQAYKSRLLLIYNLASIALTLLFIWLIYSQICVILNQWRGIRKRDADQEKPESALEPGPEPSTSLASGPEPTTALDPGDEMASSQVETDTEEALPAPTDIPQPDIAGEMEDVELNDEEQDQAST